MRSLAEFTKTTLIGGLLVVLPFYLTLLLLLKTAMGLLALLEPLTAPIPASVHFRSAIAAVLLLGTCFVAGLVVRTGPGQRAKSALDRNLLEKIPGYGLLRSLAGRIAGEEGDAAFAVALVEIEEALVPAFIVEELEDGFFTVFVPSVPTPAAGALYILPARRVHKVNVPFTTAVSVISRWGTGAGELVRALDAAHRPR
jgi:uncharacterized membrane protein